MGRRRIGRLGPNRDIRPMRSCGFKKFIERIARVSESSFHILLERSMQQVAQVARCFQRQCVPLRLALHYGCQRVRDRGACKWGAAREHLVEHAAERPDVRSFVDRLARACSGLMYAAVPMISPSRVSLTVIVGALVTPTALLP